MSIIPCEQNTELRQNLETYFEERGIGPSVFRDTDLDFIQELIEPPKKNMLKFLNEGTLREKWHVPKSKGGLGIKGKPFEKVLSKLRQR